MSEKKKKGFVWSSSPEIEAGFTRAFPSEKAIAESADRFGFTTPRSALLMGINYLLGKLENNEDIATGRRYAAKAARILTDLGVKGGVDPRKNKKKAQSNQSGGIVGEGAMSAKTQKEPKKKKIPQYYKGGGKVKKNYAYGGRVAKYKG